MTVWVGDLDDSIVVPVRAYTGAIGTPISVENPQTAGMTPDGRTALFTSSGTLSLIRVDTVNRTTRPDISLSTFGPIAVRPQGRFAWVGDGWQQQADAVQRVDLVTGAVQPLGLGSGFATDLVLTPGGTTLFFAGKLADGREGVLPISTATSKAGALIRFATTGAMTITPDGRTLYVRTGQGVVPIDVASRTPKRVIPVAASDLAASPDGRTVWATTGAGVVSIDVATRAVSAPIPGTANAFQIEVEASGDRAWLRKGGDLVPVDLAARRAGQAVGVGNQTFTITPSQAPVAGFSVIARRHGTASSFDASSSAARTGQIVRYAWTFGDGTRLVSSQPTVNHVYGKAGTYRVTLTVTDSEGTSTRRVFTGHQVLRNGGPAADATRSVTVS